uniref:EF-hand domain-containing protein n=1 Tax=Plectus sambesii TaxID=2011161 RepID=A0A914UKD3_9BILA
MATTAHNGSLNGSAGNRGSVMLSHEQIKELSELFDTIDENGDGYVQTMELQAALKHIDENGDGYVQTMELQAALKHVGIDLPGFQIRDLVSRYGGKDRLTFGEFSELYEELKTRKDVEVKSWKNNIAQKQGTYQVHGMAEHGADEIVHTIRVEEEVAFSNWINSNLASDPDLKRLVPISSNDGDLYNKVQDGLVI